MALTQVVTTNGGRRLASIGGRQLVGRSVTAASISAFQLVPANEGDTIVVRIQSNIVLAVPIALDYATDDDTATAGVDYTTTIGSTEIPAGELYVDVNVPTALRLGSQGNRAFTFTVSNATAAGETVTIAAPEAELTIFDVSAPPTVSVANNTVTEGDTIQVRVTRTSPDVLPVTFAYVTTDGTADEDLDYIAVSGTGTILANEAYVDIPVETLAREGEQATRAFTLTISNALQAGTPLTITTDTATVTILDTESSAHGYFELIRTYPEVIADESLRSQDDLNRLVDLRAKYNALQVAAGSGTYYDATKISRVFQYVYPDNDASTIYNGGNPNGTDALAGTGTWAPKDGARMYMDNSNTSTSPYYDPAIPLLDKKPWHYGSTFQRDQILRIPLGISTGKLLVTFDSWFARGWRYCRTDVPSQFKPQRFCFPNSSTFWSCHQTGTWPETRCEFDDGPLKSTSYGRLMSTLTTNDYPGSFPAGVGGRDPVYPGGLDARLGRLSGFELNFPFQIWTRHWFEIQFNQPHTAFTDWNTANGVTLGPNPVAASGGLWNMCSSWVATETAGPFRLLYKMPWHTNHGAGAGQNTIADFQFHFHTSQGGFTMTGPLVAYLRNFVAMHNYDLDATPEDDTVLFSRPLP